MVLSDRDNDSLRVKMAYSFAFCNCKVLVFISCVVQEADTEKIFYGLDDIRNASDIIIVSTFEL